MSRVGAPARRSAPALVAIAAGLCAAAIEHLPVGNPARVAAALLLVLALPGVALLGASGISRPAGRIEGCAWQAGLSIVATILVTVLLYAAGAKLGLVSWTLALTGLTAFACVIWTIRAPATAGSPRLRPPAAQTLRGLSVLAITLLLLGAAAVATVHSVSRSNAASRFTALWILPGRPAGRSVRIGIANHEGHDQTYALRVSRGRRQLLSLPAVSVATHATWNKVASIARGSGRVDVTLRRGGPSGPVYRKVYMSAPSSRR